MRRVIFLLLCFIGGCSQPPTDLKTKTLERDGYVEYYSYYLDDNQQEIKNGASLERQVGLNSIATVGRNYKNGLLDGLMIIRDAFSVREMLYENGKLTKHTQYDIWGRKVAEYTVSEDKINGTIWQFEWGVLGIKECEIWTYKNGKVISKENFDIERFKKLYDHIYELIPNKNNESY